MFLCKSNVDIVSLGLVSEIWAWMDLRLTHVKGCALHRGQRQQETGPCQRNKQLSCSNVILICVVLY